MLRLTCLQAAAVTTEYQVVGKGFGVKRLPFGPVAAGYQLLSATLIEPDRFFQLLAIAAKRQRREEFVGGVRIQREIAERSVVAG